MSLKKAFLLLLIFSVIFMLIYVLSSHIVLLSLSMNTSYADLEEILCGNAQDWSNKRIYNQKKGPCPDKGFVSVYYEGRTGNQMWEYATVYAAARTTELDGYIPKCLMVELQEHFENLTLPTFEAISHCPMELNTFVNSLEHWISNNKESVIFPRYIIDPVLVSPLIHEVVKEFKFKTEIRDLAQQCLHEVIKELPPKNFTFVGVHVRRTDYISYLKKKSLDIAGVNFYIKAMEYYKSKYPDCLFVYVSDDPTWCYRQFSKLENVVIVRNNTAAVDMAMMAACNHSIFDYGTYGEWGSILAGGEVVVTEHVRKEAVSMYKSWIKLPRN